MPTIVILGWGSLLWCRKNLRNEGAWKRDGPLLPIEFAKISGRGNQRYLSLVLRKDSDPIQTYWDRSLETDLNEARENLSQREGCKKKHINGIDQDGQLFERPGFPGMEKPISEWLASKREEVDAVIWTDLRPKLEDGTPVTVENCFAWLEHRRLSGEHETAKEYIRMAPKQTDTALRRQVREQFGWGDIPIIF